MSRGSRIPFGIIDLVFGEAFVGPFGFKNLAFERSSLTILQFLTR